PTAKVEIRTQSREQFLAEANILARLDHPSLPKVSDYFIENEDQFLVMDYVEGEDLDSLLQRSGEPLAEDQVVPWIDQVLDGLSYLHTQRTQPIIHRDIKPANLRLNMQQNRVKLVDFGLVKLLDNDNPETKVELRGIGTPAYAPLEQFATSEQHTDTRSDIYSLGATMYHLMTNLYPPDVHQRVLNPNILASPRVLNPNLSENTERVILKAMEVHPDQRFQSAAEMRAALAKRGRAVPVRPASRPDSSMSPVLFAGLGALFVLLILGGVAYWVFNRGNSPVTPVPQPGGVEAGPSSTPTDDVVVSGFNSVPTDTPTPTVPPTHTPVMEDEPEPTATPTPLPQPTATTAAVVTQPAGLSAATLSGTIAFPVFNGTNFDLYFGQADGSGIELYRRGASQPAFSPDGSRIAFHSWGLSARGLVTMDIGGSNEVIVAAFIEDQLPTWHANGQDIIFLSRREGDRKSRLLRVGSREVRGAGAILGEGEYPTVGATGQLVFRGWGNTGTGIRLGTALLQNLQQITTSDDDTAPALSPDGSLVAFMSRRAGNWDIYVANSDGSGLRQLTDDPADDGLPTWSPDGRAIAFVTSRGGSWSMRAIAPNGSNEQQLFALPGPPDGFVGADR
ncbi:MAG: protein kinase, partial [Anaerolineae bacterium]|nr:protein kinase [Anaerolineae bacterium]